MIGNLVVSAMSFHMNKQPFILTNCKQTAASSTIVILTIPWFLKIGANKRTSNAVFPFDINSFVVYCTFVPVLLSYDKEELFTQFLVFRSY